MVISLRDSFRICLHEATRVEEDGLDWTPHTVDYVLFKQILKRMSNRRYQIRNMLRKSPDGRLSEEAIAQVMGSSVLTDFRAGHALPNPVSRSEDDDLYEAAAANYVNLQHDDRFVDESDSFEKKSKRKSRASVFRMLAYEERKELVHVLKSEVDKVHMFYLSQWQRVSLILEQCSASTATEFDFAAASDELLELQAFCVINVVTVYQILIRFDAYARTYEGTPIMDYWIKHNLRFATPFRKVLRHEELSALADSFAELAQESAVLFSFDTQRKLFATILSAAETGQMTASSGHILFSDSIVHTLRSWIVMASFEDRLGLEPSYLMMRGKSLRAEMQRIVEWRRNKDGAIPFSPVSQKKELSPMQIFNLTLNLLSGFLYCMNYYIVEPSSTMYVNRLGAFDAMSGTLIGMVPLAAFISSVPFSMWTNHSFRSPFILSSCLLVVGNILYSVADQFRDVRIALLGRFITGLGAPKCIIRRYMADTTPMNLRTNVNAMFGMVVAAGSAMGPAMAIVLNSFEFTFYSPVTGLVVLNGLTLPGYFMAMLWITFTFIILLTFEEPDREGLEEQRFLESVGRTRDELSPVNRPRSPLESDMNTIFSGDSEETGAPSVLRKGDGSLPSPVKAEELGVPLSLEVPNEELRGWRGKVAKHYLRMKEFSELITTPVRLCLGLLFAKVFTIEILVSATSALSKNRYKWQVHQVGTLGFVNGCLVIPFSVLIGRLSMSLQDRQLMRYLVAAGIFGFFLLIDLSDLVHTENGVGYNVGHPLAVGPRRYVAGYFLTYLSIQTFEGVIGSTLSKVIPTALASTTLNSGLLATLVDTFGRACGDNFISMAGFISIRQLMNLLFIPGFLIMLTCLFVIERCRDMLSV